MDHVGRGFRSYMNKPGISEQYKEMVQTVLSDADVKSFLDKQADVITQQTIDNSYSKLYEFVQQKNKIPQGEE